MTIVWIFLSVIWVLVAVTVLGMVSRLVRIETALDDLDLKYYTAVETLSVLSEEVTAMHQYFMERQDGR